MGKKEKERTISFLTAFRTEGGPELSKGEGPAIDAISSGNHFLCRGGEGKKKEVEKKKG